MCLSSLSRSCFLSSRFANTSQRRCLAVSSSLYFLARLSTSLSGLGLPTKVPFCISRIFTISRPGGTRAVSIISHKASKSPSQVSGLLFSSSFSILVILASIPKWSQNSCTSGSISDCRPAAAAAAAAAAAGSATASCCIGCPGTTIAGTPGTPGTPPSCGGGATLAAGGSAIGGAAGAGGAMGGADPLLMIWPTSDFPISNATGGPLMVIFLGTPSGKF